MSRLVLALVLASVLPASSAGASAAGPAHVEHYEECYDNVPLPHEPFCTVRGEAHLTVADCGDAACTLLLESNAWALARLPGWLNLETVSLVFAGGSGATGSACLGPDPLADTLANLVSCERLCRADAVGHVASCTGSKTQVVPLPPGGHASVTVHSHLGYDSMVAFGNALFRYDIWRDEAGAVTIEALDCTPENG